MAHAEIALAVLPTVEDQLPHADAIGDPPQHRRHCPGCWSKEVFPLLRVRRRLPFGGRGRHLTGLAQLPNISPLPLFKPPSCLFSIARKDLRIAPRPAVLGPVRYRHPVKAFLRHADMDFRTATEGSGTHNIPAPLGITALLLQRPGINPGLHPGPLKRPVLVRRPDLSPFTQHLVAVPFAGLDPPQPLRRGLP